jgi:hypothetical protein
MKKAASVAASTISLVNHAAKPAQAATGRALPFSPVRSPALMPTKMLAPNTTNALASTTMVKTKPMA